MTAVEHLKLQAEFAFGELMSAVDSVSEGQAWAILPDAGTDYLHTDASIQGITLHIASGKLMYASSSFLGGTIRWREVADQIEAIEPSWSGAVEYLKKSHSVWMESWAGLSDEDLLREVAHIRGRLVPAHQIISLVTHHDGWHGGQIALLRYGVKTSDVPSPSQAEDIRKYCSELPLW